MPSSTSSSEGGPVAAPSGPTIAVPLSASVVLVGLVLGIVLLLELGTRLLMPAASRIEGRITREYRDAEALKGGVGGRATALIVGNSLLLEGVDFERLRVSLAEHSVDARRLVVEQTGFLDWQYGIVRLIEAGAKPDAFVIVLSFEHLTSKVFRGSYSAHRLLRLADILPLAHELGLGTTETSSLVFSRLSAFYGLREEVRKQAMFRLVPDYPVLTTRLLAPPAGSETDRFGNVPLAAERLAALRNRVEKAGSQLIFVEPPTPVPNPQASFERGQEAGRRASVDVLIPLRHDELEATDYADGYHLAAGGAAKFTERLARPLATAIGAAADRNRSRESRR